MAARNRCSTPHDPNVPLVSARRGIRRHSRQACDIGIVALGRRPAVRIRPVVARNFDAVLFDAGETLVHPHPSFGGLIARFLSERGHAVDQATFERVALDAATEAGLLAHSQGIAWTTSTVASRTHWTGIYRTLLAHFEIADDAAPDAMYDQFSQPVHYRLFPDSLPALRMLSASGYALGLVSNWEAWLSELLDLLDVTKLFKAVVVSGAVGIEKPDPAIFRSALEAMNVEPARAVYVGDSVLHDVEPALAIGMRAVLVDRHRRHEASAHPTVSSLDQLPDLLENLRPRRQPV
jgi:putative hydrolase of the HAD superfamily